MATQHAVTTSYTDAAMLALVKQAIANVLVAGVSYGLPGGRQWTSADLPSLRAMEQDYQSRVDSESGGMAVNLARFKR